MCVHYHHRPCRGVVNTHAHGKDFLSFLVSHHRSLFLFISFIHLVVIYSIDVHLIIKLHTLYGNDVMLIMKKSLSVVFDCISLTNHDDESVYLFFFFFFVVVVLVVFVSLSSIVMKLTFHISFSFICRLEFISHA